MLPAKVPITDPRYGGPILFNPGGPGVSAIMVLLSEGRTFLSQFDTPEDPSSTKGDDDARYYDVVAFDPRGINHTLPVANCFETDLQRAEWNLRTAAAGIPGSSNVSVAESWGRQRAYSLACYNFTQSSGANNIMPFITTASTARDMVTFIDRFGEWRKAEAQRMLMGRTPSHLRYQEGIERINYYGLSYGSFLGMTFASMFPERTGRFVLDGIVDTDDYIHALWTVSVLDSSKTMDVFYSMCAEAGPKTCALARNGSSAEDVRVRLQNILDRAYEHPIASTGQIPDYWTWSDVRTLLITSLYQPLMWQQFASTMAALDGASSSPLVATTADTYYPVPGKLPPVFQNIDAETGTSCGDAFPFDGDFTLQDAQAHWEHLYELGPIMAADFVALNYTCAAWPGRPKYAYRGPFGSSANSSVPPMLFIGNTADPITPIYAARKMVARFSGARLLTNDMPGHSSEAVPNACTMAHGRAYMQTGTLPPEGFVCPMNGTLFPDPESDGGGD
ncbi:hypothetical protein EV356DRAFT_505069 [Viridothelium virens]|uniref:Peptidase S33 tripeptidyl aminopeptidase-like C-terminal domain-containing protein n=1 Tax=Viridothelium virens TaxID=1048519 RepID=A0A6A6H4A6_VIRVR|nr:hypothetical protein EV356DRAFT_505069 [Viridothelium virens]